MADNSNPTRVGLIGYGFAGKTFHAPLIGAVPGLSLVAVCSRDRAKVLADLPQVEVVDDAVGLATSGNIDLVVNAAPNDTHVPLARAALGAHKHAALADRQQRLLSVFHNRRRDSDFLSVRRAIADGVIGRVAHFESHFDDAERVASA